MIMNAKARQISVWDTVDLAVRLAVHTTDPKACRHAMRLLVDELGDDIPLRQAFLHALIKHGEIGSSRGIGRVLAYEHAAQAYLSMRDGARVRQCDVDLLMIAGKVDPSNRSRIESVLREGEGVHASDLAMLFVLAAGYDGEDARVKFYGLQGGDQYHLPGQIHVSRNQPGLIGGGDRDVPVSRMFAPVHILQAAKEMDPAVLAA